MADLVAPYADFKRESVDYALMIRDVERKKNYIGNIAEKIQRFIIDEGLSTGDRFVDFEFARFGRHFNDKRVERYRMVDSVLKGFLGQLVLVVAHCPTDSSVLEYNDVGRESKIYCGTLTGEDLVLDTKSPQATCGLPTSDFFIEDGKRLENGVITEGSRDGRYIGPFLLPIMKQQVFAEGLSEASVSRIYPGDHYTLEWLQKHRASNYDDVALMLRSLNRPELLKRFTKLAA